MCVQKSMHVIFSFAFSPRYAKTRTSNFHEVVWQHSKGMVGFCWKFTSLYCSDRILKIWIWQRYHREFGVLIFCDTVYISQDQLVTTKSNRPVITTAPWVNYYNRCTRIMYRQHRINWIKIYFTYPITAHHWIQTQVSDM